MESSRPRQTKTDIPCDHFRRGVQVTCAMIVSQAWTGDQMDVD